MDEKPESKNSYLHRKVGLSLMVTVRTDPLLQPASSGNQETADCGSCKAASSHQWAGFLAEKKALKQKNVILSSLSVEQKLLFVLTTRSAVLLQMLHIRLFSHT